MEEQQEDPIAKKKRKQHEAWKRWYDSDKGKVYRERYKQRHKELKILRAESK